MVIKSNGYLILKFKSVLFYQPKTYLFSFKLLNLNIKFLKSISISFKWCVTKIVKERNYFLAKNKTKNFALGKRRI